MKAIPSLCVIPTKFSERGEPFIFSRVIMTAWPPSRTGIGSKLIIPNPMLIKAISIKKENKPPYLIESPAYWPIITGPPRFRGEINPWTIFFKKIIDSADLEYVSFKALIEPSKKPYRFFIIEEGRIFKFAAIPINH